MTSGIRKVRQSVTRLSHKCVTARNGGLDTVPERHGSVEMTPAPQVGVPRSVGEIPLGYTVERRDSQARAGGAHQERVIQQRLEVALVPRHRKVWVPRTSVAVEPGHGIVRGVPEVFQEHFEVEPVELRVCDSAKRPDKQLLRPPQGA